MILGICSFSCWFICNLDYLFYQLLSHMTYLMLNKLLSHLCPMSSVQSAVVSSEVNVMFNQLSSHLWPSHLSNQIYLICDLRHLLNSGCLTCDLVICLINYDCLICVLSLLFIWLLSHLWPRSAFQSAVVSPLTWVLHSVRCCLYWPRKFV